MSRSGPGSVPASTARSGAVLAACATLLLTACGHHAVVGHSRTPFVQPRASGTTACGGDGRGACPSLGRPTAGEPTPGVVGADTEVALAPYFNRDVVTTAAAGLHLGGFGGAAFAESTFPSSGSLTLRAQGGDSVTFLIPAFGPGVRSALALDQATTIPLPPGVYGQLWLLEAARGGTFGPVDATLTYADKTVARVPVTFADWCNGGLPMRGGPPDSVGVVVPYVLGPAGSGVLAAATGTGDPQAEAAPALLTSLPTACGLWAERVDLPLSTQPIAALTLPALPTTASAGAFVMAVTLKTVDGVTTG